MYHHRSLQELCRDLQLKIDIVDEARYDLNIKVVRSDAEVCKWKMRYEKNDITFPFTRFEICLVLDFLKLINNIHKTHFWSITFYLFFHLSIYSCFNLFVGWLVQFLLCLRKKSVTKAAFIWSKIQYKRQYCEILLQLAIIQELFSIWIYYKM